MSVKLLIFFQDYAREKWPLRGSKHTDNLYRCRVSGVRKASRKILKPEHLKPNVPYKMLSDKGR